FYLPGILDGTYVLTVTHPKMAPWENREFSVGRQSVVTHPDVALSPGATVRGRVLLPDSRPDPKAMVQIAQVGTQRAPHSVRTASTDPSGRFEIAGLTPGDYRIVVAQRDGKPDLGTLFRSLKQPNTFKLAAGEVKDLDL